MPLGDKWPAGSRPADAAVSQRQACVQLATKDKVAFAMGMSNIYDTANCTAKEYHIPFLTVGGTVPTDDDMATAYPFMFTTSMTTSRVLRNWPYWAKDQGFLSAGSKLATLNTDNPGYLADFDKSFKPQLAKLGYKLTAEALFSASLPSSVPNAVQRFKAAGVDVVFLGAGGALTAFAQE